MRVYIGEAFHGFDFVTWPFHSIQASFCNWFNSPPPPQVPENIPLLFSFNGKINIFDTIRNSEVKAIAFTPEPPPF